MATKLAADIKAYFHAQALFQGGKSDGRDWWKSLLVNVTSHPLKAMAIKLFSIVPHAGEVERFFSNLGGVQSVKCSHLTVSHMETLGMLCNHYTCQLHEAVLAAGKSMHHKHAHMHTQPNGEIDVRQAEDLIKAFNWTPLPPNFNANLEGLEEMTEEELNEELEKIGSLRPTGEGDGLDVTIPMEQVFDTSNLDSIQAGNAPLTIDEELSLNIENAGPCDKWDAASLM